MRERERLSHLSVGTKLVNNISNDRRFFFDYFSTFALLLQYDCLCSIKRGLASRGS